MAVAAWVALQQGQAVKVIIDNKITAMFKLESIKEVFTCHQDCYSVSHCFFKHYYSFFFLLLGYL